MRISQGLAGLAFLLSLASCVTINIYFPAAAAEKAADKIIKEVWGEEAAGKKTPESPEPQSSHEATPAWRALLELVVPAAHAAADIDVSSPAINRIKASMSKRHEQLEPFYNSGAVGLTNDGLVAVRDPGGVPLRDRRAVNTLVADENRDRQALYSEIARANKHPEWEGDIRSTFARRWIANARGGWWYQDGGGRWLQK